MSKVSAEIVENYKNLQKELKAILKNYGISIAYVCRKTSIPRSTFDRKLSEFSFTSDEMERIVNAINN